MTGPDEYKVERMEWWKILDDAPTSLPWLWRLRALQVLDGAVIVWESLY